MLRLQLVMRVLLRSGPDPNVTSTATITGITSHTPGPRTISRLARPFQSEAYLQAGGCQERR